MPAQRATFDEALTKHVGELGRGQLAIVILTSLFYIPNVAIFYLLVFTTIDPIAVQQSWACSDAADAACSAVWHAPEGPAFCSLQPSQWHWTSTANLAARFSMVCGNKWKVQMLNMAMFCGCLVGAALFGFANDRFGRKKPMVAASLAVAACVFVTTAAPSYAFMAVVRFITGIAAAGQNQCIALLNTEIAGKSKRGRASIISGMFWAMGEFVLVGLAVAVPSWRSLTLVAASMASAALLWVLAIPESARWLLSQGREEEATAVVRRIAAWNGTSLPAGLQLVASQPAPGDDQQDGSKDADVLAEGSSQQAEVAGKLADGDGGCELGRAGGCAGGLIRSGADLDKQQQAAAAAGTASGALSSTGSSGRDLDKASDLADAAVLLAAAAAAPPAAGSNPQGRGGGKTMPSSSSSSSLGACSAGSSSSSETKVKRLRLQAALHHRRLLKRTLVLVFTWFSLYIVSYGVNLGSGALPGSVYVTFSLLTAAEITAQLLTALVADKAGRHNILSFGLVLAGAACLGCATTGSRTAKAVLAVLGKFSGTIGMAVLGTFTTELFATPIRATAMGVFNEAGRFGSIIAPLMLMLGAQVLPDNAVFIPFLVFGLSALVGGCLTLLLPETLGAAMPESVEDMNQLLSVFTAQPWRQGPMATVRFMFRARAARAGKQQGLPPAASGGAAADKQQKSDRSDVLMINVICGGSGSGAAIPASAHHRVEQQQQPSSQL